MELRRAQPLAHGHTHPVAHEHTHARHDRDADTHAIQEPLAQGQARSGVRRAESTRLQQALALS